MYIVYTETPAFIFEKILYLDRLLVYKISSRKTAGEVSQP